MDVITIVIIFLVVFGAAFVLVPNECHPLFNPFVCAKQYLANSPTYASSSSAPISTSGSASLPQICIGDCKIGQSATDGKYNHQKFTINTVYFLKHPYIDPDPDIGHEWHNWDWVLLDISLENLRSEKIADYGIGELKAANNADLQCFGNRLHSDIELTDFDFNNIAPGEVRRGNISCLIDPTATMPFTYYYYFDDWYGEKSGQGGKTAKFVIDRFIQLDYNSIKSSLHGEKPF